MTDSNLLDDIDAEGQQLGEALVLAAAMVTWLRLVLVVGGLIAIGLFCSGIITLLFLGAQPMSFLIVFASLFSFGLGVLWLRAMSAQYRFMKWLHRLSTYQTQYDIDHWVYLNAAMWRWTGIAASVSTLVFFFINL
jgi:hypothetical protein